MQIMMKVYRIVQHEGSDEVHLEHLKRPGDSDHIGAISMKMDMSYPLCDTVRVGDIYPVEIAGIGNTEHDNQDKIRLTALLRKLTELCEKFAA